MEANGRVAWVDCAKAIGITLVVYGHVTRGIVAAGIKMPQHFYELTDSVIYSFHMPLFFFLAGIFFFRSYDSKRRGFDFALSKIDTVFYPYVIWSLLQGGIEASLAGYTNSHIPYSEVLAVLWRPRAQFWFLFSLFLIFALSAILFRWIPKRGAIAVLALSALLYAFPALLPQNYVLSYIASGLVFFVLGIVFDIHVNEEMFFSVKVFAALLIAAVVGQFLFHVVYGHTYLDIGLGSLAIAVLSVLLVVNISYFLSLLRIDFVLFVGASSLAIFVMHVLAASGLRVVLQKFAHVDSYVVHLVLGVAAGLFGPLVVLSLPEKFGIRHLMSARVSRLFRSNHPASIKPG